MMKWEQDAPNIILGALKNIISGKVRSLYPSKSCDGSQDTLNKVLPPLREDIKPPKSATVLNFSCGMQTLTDRIVDELRNQEHVTLSTGSKVRKLGYNGDKYEQTGMKTTTNSDAVFICTPVNQMGAILSSRSFIQPDIARLLSPEVFTSASLAVVALEFDTPNLKPPRGFGHLIPLCEDDTVMGVIYDSFCSPLMDGKSGDKRTTRFTVMLSPRKEWLEATHRETSFSLQPSLQDELVTIAIDALKVQLRINFSKPCSVHAGLWRNTIPTYPIGHLENKRKLRKAIQDRLGTRTTLHLVGNALDGVGVGDCVKSAVKAVDSFVNNKFVQ